MAACVGYPHIGDYTDRNGRAPWDIDARYWLRQKLPDSVDPNGVGSLLPYGVLPVSSLVLAGL